MQAGTARKPSLKARLSIVNDDVEVNAVRPLSPAWHCIADPGRTSARRLHIDLTNCQALPLGRSANRSPVSPLARFPPVSADAEDEDDWEMQDETAGSCIRPSYGEDSDTASEWSARE